MSTETSFWHPYADMGSVRHSEHVMARAEDVWVWDTDGNRYLDATAGLWYANVGHGRPEIRAAVAAQMERLEACSAFFDLANPPVLELAEALAERAPMPGVTGSTPRPSWPADIGGRSARGTARC